MKTSLIILVVVVVVVLGVILLRNSGPEPSLETQEPNMNQEQNRLIIEDVRQGSGEEAAAGSTIVVHYVGTLQSGEKFDSSRDRDTPFSLKLGAAQVIPGWEQGLVGMKEGGLRKLTIPPDLAYGSSGIPGAIPPNATLLFEIELLEVQK